ncbi:glycosyltransferase [Aeromicrobium sp. S22]|uniref:glycosyltransferase n=1 Tax=Aeromicrobium sp. S22 TaxID=2662029 RepID=UPI0035C88AD8
MTYNRPDDLRVCLNALLALSTPVDEVIVVDNASTDETPEILASEYPELTIHRTQANLGGAGGFALAIELAIASGHSHAWLMDDDAVPALDSYDALYRLISDRGIQPPPAFLASRVVQPDGADLVSHMPTPTTDPQGAALAASYGCVQVEYASFVGVLVDLSYARKTYLPVAEFFLMVDDLEYTSRLGMMSPGWLVPSSCVAHPDKKVEDKYNPRWWIGVRNSLWIARDRRLGSPFVRRGRVRGTVRPIVSSAIRSPSKIQYCKTLWSILVAVVRNPPNLRRP